MIAYLLAEWPYVLPVALTVACTLAAWVRLTRWLDRPITDDDRECDRLDADLRVQPGVCGGFRVRDVLDQVGEEAGAVVIEFPRRPVDREDVVA